MRQNRSKYAVLGILSLGPMSGYDIKKVFQTIASNFWNESYGQIYPMLKRLTAEGLATKSVERQSGKPDRHVYSLTEKGREKLQTWLLNPVELEIGRHEILLKLFFGAQVSVIGNTRQLELYRELRGKALHELQSTEQHLRAEHANDPNLPYWLMTVSYGLHVNQAILEWCDETLSALGRMAGETEKESGTVTETGEEEQ
jgi:PadR family transcriptional regulator AphA